MNTRVETFFRPGTQKGSRTWETGAWLAAIACALAIAVVAVIGLPGILVLPAVALALFAASVVPVIATWRHAPDIREKGWLFAGMLFVIGVVASVASDLDAMVTYFG